MNYLSVCSGIEAATVAWHPLGWLPAAFAEVDTFPSAVLAHHYPQTPNLGDMTRFQEWPDANIDLLVGGTPCQSFSVAGLRAGLDDPRGSLMLVYLAIARRYRPRWLVWENVPGVLSSDNGRAFGSLLRGLADLRYGFAYRVLDAQYFGLAQRRRRVFVVGYLGDWRRAAAVLLERASLSGHPAPRREAREVVAPTIAARTRGGGGLGTDFDCDGGLIASTGAVSHCLNAGGMGRIDYETETLIAQPYTLAIRGRGDSHDLETRQDGLANALLTPNGGRGGIGVGAIAFDTTQITSAANYSNPKAGNPCHPLAAGAHPPAVAFDWQSGGDSRGLEPKDTAQLQRCQVPAVAFSVQDNGRDAGAISPIMRANRDAYVGGNVGVAYGMQVRRLTPRECERLQGFPDDYTLIPYRGKPASDGPRYKALGNSMAVPCMRWIGERIAFVDTIAMRVAS